MPSRFLFPPYDSSIHLNLHASSDPLYKFELWKIFIESSLQAHKYSLFTYMSKPENIAKLRKQCCQSYRGSYLLKYMCKGLVKQLLYYHMRHGRGHGNLKPENIVYNTRYYSRPEFINHISDANEGSIAKDYEDMAYIISELKEKASIADVELNFFLKDLKSMNVAGAVKRNHYFFKSPKEKKFFIEDVWNANVFSTHQAYVGFESYIFDVQGFWRIKQVLDSKFDKPGEDTKTLRYNLKQVRNFFEHGHDKRGKYTDEDMEQILFEACPKFWTVLYDRLHNMGILMHYFPMEAIHLVQIEAEHMDEP